MQNAIKMATKSCVPQKFRGDNSDEEVNQEVVQQNYVTVANKQPIHRSPRSVTDPSWKLHRSPTPKAKLPTAKVSQEYNWQASQSSVRERNAVMYNNPLMADVHFTVGVAPNIQKVPAHKYVLAIGSSVFHAMFYGGLADRQDSVELPDVEPAAFQNLLRYFSCLFEILYILRPRKKYVWFRLPDLPKICTPQP